MSLGGTKFNPDPIQSVGAAEGCDLLILILKNKIKRSQPSAAPTGSNVIRDNPEQLYCRQRSVSAQKGCVPFMPAEGDDKRSFPGPLLSFVRL
ncbi:hypothetical protein [Pseudomonas sp. PD9R]|uniref:hypothetical protein n=1 Tax=Pseudomonas sp. PD9R TaxID=2853534 RepID=UPI001C48E7C7|nr:hypothetical protein [Pseudomonas sp. PD9R]MBV6827146.1 hypothetical protein [Pseudomonas sp. PD9R]